MLTEPRPRRILVDIDSTLYDSDPLWIDCLRRVHDRELTLDDLHQWDWYRHIGLTRPQFDRLIREHYHSPEQILTNEPYPGSVATLRRWRGRGHEIHIVSDRAPSTTEATRAWLEQHGFVFDHTRFALRINKFAYAKEHSIELVIDDRPSFLEALVKDGEMIAATIEQRSNMAVREMYPAIISAPAWPALARKLDKKLDL